MLWVWEWSLQIYSFTEGWCWHIISCQAPDVNVFINFLLGWSDVPEKDLPVSNVGVRFSCQSSGRWGEDEGRAGGSSIQQSLFIFHLVPLFFLNFIIYLSHAGSSLLCGLFSSCSEWGPLSSCTGVSLLWFLSRQSTGLGCTGFSSCMCGLSSCSSWVLESRLSNRGPQA